jgi:hypothetical protein
MEPREALAKVRRINVKLARDLQAIETERRAGKLKDTWVADERVRLRAAAAEQAKAIVDAARADLLAANFMVEDFDVDPNPVGSAALTRAVANAARVAEDELLPRAKTSLQTDEKKKALEDQLERIRRAPLRELRRLATEERDALRLAEVRLALETKGDAGDTAAAKLAEQAGRRLVELVAAEPLVQKRRAHVAERTEVGELLRDTLRAIETPGQDDIGLHYEDCKVVRAAREAGVRGAAVLVTEADGSSRLILREPRDIVSTP